MFDPAVDLSMNAGIADVLPYLSNDLINKCLSLAFFQIDRFHQIVVDLRLQIYQGKINQLDLHR